MPPQRRKDPVSARRRVKDDGDDEGSVINEAIDDSLSEGSIPSDADDDGDADDSDLSDNDNKGITGSAIRPARSNGSSRKERTELSLMQQSPAPLKRSSSEPLTFETTKETEAMMNGLSISQDGSKTDVIEFENSEKMASDDTQEAVSKAKAETLADRRRREHEEYKQKRDSDPAFIPTRGAFFMHDSRHSGPGGLFRGVGRGRGRGRGGPPAPFLPAAASYSNEPTNNPWSHDLHDTLLEPPQKHNAPPNAPSGPSNITTGAIPSPNIPTVRSFSTTQVLGKIQIRVFLPFMKEPVTYSDATVKRYTKLPNHRPPLRRDKPVRVSMPMHNVRYIFPSMDRSFIFIPRAMRPNQQGFGRGRGKGVGSYGGFSSRRTSIYGGSIYSPSIAMSRRSSIARDGMASPALSLMSGRPVVRLPPGSHHQHTGSGTPMRSGGISGSGTPVFGIPQGPAAMGQNATYRENWPSNLQMHQPRPQKTISVTGIEYPATTYQAPIPTEQQPFHHQVPHQMNGSVQDPNAYSHSRQVSYPNPPPASGTPLSNIPERAIHAQPFQPYQVGYNQYGGQPAYYYTGGTPTAGQFTQGAVIAPMYVQTPQQGGYIMPTIAAATPPQQPASGPIPGFVAHEQNGMVYYIDPSQMYTPPAPEGYGSGNYAVPPADPNGYYYPQVPGTMYYPPQ